MKQTQRILPTTLLAGCGPVPSGGDGHRLLEVGAMPGGRIEPRQVVVLQQAGVRTRRNGQSIHGTPTIP